MSAEENKQIVQALLNEAIMGEGPGAAFDRFAKANYVQHNPRLPNGKEGFVEFINIVLGCKDFAAEPKRVIAEDDLVVIHAKITGFHWPDEPAPSSPQSFAWVDVFRLEDGKVAEHWDLYQPIPPEDRNGNGMV